ncbi:hypothetical protein [Mesobacillus subterraneus]|nr:hypothetical protein [Mesobacillus subterraneus]
MEKKQQASSGEQKPSSNAKRITGTRRRRKTGGCGCGKKKKT